MTILTIEHPPCGGARRYQLQPETVRHWNLEETKLAGGSAWRIREEALAAIEQHPRG